MARQSNFTSPFRIEIKEVIKTANCKEAKKRNNLSLKGF